MSEAQVASDVKTAAPVAPQAPVASSAGKPESNSNEGRNVRRLEEGIVLSDVRQKTITVEIKHLVKHQRYGKYIFRSTHLHAHDEKNEAKKGDRVEIVETRPISKQKRWRLVRIIERAAVMGTLEIKEVEVAPKKIVPPETHPPVESGAPTAPVVANEKKES